MNAGNWGAFLSGGVQGAQTEQQMEGKDLQNRYYKDALVDPASQENQYWTQARRQNQVQNGQQPWHDSGMLFDPVRNALLDMYKSAVAKMSSFLPGQGQHAMGPAAQSTTGQPTNVPMSAPGPSSSNPASGGLPGATGPMPLPDQPQTTGRPFADGGIPGRGRSGALRNRKAKPGNIAKPTKAAQVAMHPPMEKAPVDAQEMGAEGGPPRNTDAQSGSQDPMLADGGQLNIKKAIKHPGALHEDLGVPQGQKIPKGKLDAAAAKGGKVGQRARFAETLSKFSNGGAVDKPMPFKEPAAPKPQPNAVDKDVSNDGQRNRLGRTIKKFADGGVPKDQPAPGLEPAAEPESTGAHLLKAGAKFLGMTALSPESPYQQAANLVGSGVSAAKDYLSSPWESPPAKAAAAPPKAIPARGGAPVEQQGPPAPYDDDPSIIEHGMVTRGPDGKPITPYNAAAMTSLLHGSGGGVYHPASAQPPGGPAPEGAEAGPTSGSAAPQGPPPIDFSQVQLDHQEIPNTSTQEWDKMKKGIISQLVVTRKAGPEQAAMMADDQVSQFQHQNFMQYMQQGIALDRAGNKQGAMAALKTAYNYMPTGHGMHFGLGPDGNIVGVGWDEDTGKPVGAPVKLDQGNLNHLMATYSDPKNFQGETLAMQEQKRKNAETYQGTIPLQRATAATELQGKLPYLQGRNAELEEVARIRADSRNAAQHMPPDVSLKVNSALRGSGIMDPNDIFAATGVAAQLMQRGHNQADATALAGMMFSPGVDPMRRQQIAARYGIQLADPPPGPAGDLYSMGVQPR